MKSIVKSQNKTGAYSILNTIFKHLKRKIKELEYVYLVGGQREAWVQAEATLAFYNDYWPIVWEDTKKSPVLKSKKEKGVRVCEITNEKMIPGGRADIVIAAHKFIDDCVANKDKVEKFRQDFKKNKFHYIELKFAEIEFDKVFKNSDSKYFLKKNLWNDFNKLKKSNLLKCQSIIAICILRIYGSRNCTEDTLNKWIKKQGLPKGRNSMSASPSLKIKKLGRDYGVQFFLISYYQESSSQSKSG